MPTLDLKKIEETFYQLIDSITQEDLDDFYNKLEPALVFSSIKCESVKINDMNVGHDHSFEEKDNTYSLAS